MRINVPTKDRIADMENKLSIASGKAALALSQMLKCKVNVNLSSLHIIPLSGITDVFDEASTPVVGVKMSMFGDLNGSIFFMLPVNDQDSLMRQISEAAFGPNPGVGLDISILEEVGNIVAGVYLTGICDLYGFNIYHSLPSVTQDMFSSLIDEAVAGESMAGCHVVLIESLFTITHGSIKTFLMLIPSADSASVFLDSMGRGGNR